MSTERDPVEILDQLRPVSAVQEHWHGEPPPRQPRVEIRRPHTRRVLLVSALVAALLVAGTGIAGAAGLLPDSFTRPLAFWSHETQGQIDVQNARRIAQEPGPNGTVLSVWSAHSAAGATCIAPMFEAPGPLDRPAPADFQLAGGQCTPHASGEPFGNLGASSDQRNITTAWITAGKAVKADMQFRDGTTRPALKAEGMFFVWYAADPQTGPPKLIGYDVTGHVVGTTSLPG